MLNGDHETAPAEQPSPDYWSRVLSVYAKMQEDSPEARMLAGNFLTAQELARQHADFADWTDDRIIQFVREYIPRPVKA